MYRYLLVISLLAFGAFTAMAQSPDTSGVTQRSKKAAKDTLVSTNKDTIIARSFIPKVKKEKEKTYHPDTTHDPQKALIRSLIIPGWGQLYNHRWWKVPVIYGGLSLLGVAFIFNNTYYHEFLALSKYREHGTPIVPGIPYYNQAILYANQPNQALYDAVNGYQRNRDLCILGTLGAWGINVIDAYIDAKFQHSYSVDNNLSMKVEPSVLNQPVYALNPVGSFIPGVKFTFTF